ncbi:MAG: LysE family translocator [Chromatiales bacterium]|nr:LysE family translocator [Chromatiales bacterium]
MELLTFILISIGVILIPGPNVLVVISTSITQGKLRGLQTVVGTSAAMIIQLVVAALGTAWFVSALAEGFFWLKWIGVAYLIYLGVSHLIRAASARQEPEITAIASMQRGFWVSLTNPKTILFFSAFLPQFAVSTAPYLEQIALLSVIFWVLAAILDSGYALLASRLSALLNREGSSKQQNRASGILYLGAGTLLATTKTG